MTEQLPISINVSPALIESIKKINSVTNKLEAQLNFRTLTAGWYGDEEEVLKITLMLLTTDDLTYHRNQAYEGEYHSYSDDVFTYFNEPENHITCYLALTESEIRLLSKSSGSQQKLLTQFLALKTEKVLNLIAEQHKLFPL